MNNGNTVSYIDEATLKKLNEYAATKNGILSAPVVDRVKEIELMLKKCSDTIYEMQEYYNVKSYLTDKQFLLLRAISQVIEVKSGDIKINPVPVSEIKKETVVEGEKELIMRCLAQNPASRFEKSVAKFYNKNGRITDKQREVLIRYSATYVSPVIKVDIESVEYKVTLGFLLKCEEAFPDSNFVKSVKEQFVRNGRITDRQRTALLKTLKEAEDKIKTVVVDEVKNEDVDEVKNEDVDEVKE